MIRMCRHKWLPEVLYNAPVAQLDRVPGYELGGREFESLRARHLMLRHQAATERPVAALVFQINQCRSLPDLPFLEIPPIRGELVIVVHRFGV